MIKPDCIFLMAAALSAVLLSGTPYAQDGKATAIDDRGRTLVLPLPARRIVSLAPSITELVYAAGAGDQLVGVASYSDYPPMARGVAQIGDASRVDVERVLSLRPDLVIGWRSGNHAADIARLERFGFPVFVAEPATLAAIPQLLRAIGVLAGTAATARVAASGFERGIEALRKRYGARGDVRVFYEIWHEPLMTVNGAHMISDVIRLCGGSNVFAELAPLTPVVALEGVLAARPEVVLGGGSATRGKNSPRNGNAIAFTPRYAMCRRCTWIPTLSSARRRAYCRARTRSVVIWNPYGQAAVDGNKSGSLSARAALTRDFYLAARKYHRGRRRG